MTGKFRLGKMSIGMRARASTLPRTSAAMPTMTVYGRRSAKTIGFIAASYLDRPPSRSFARPRPRIAPFLANRLEWLILVLHDLGNQFLQFVARLGQDFSSGQGGTIILPLPAINDLRWL